MVCSETEAETHDLAHDDRPIHATTREPIDRRVGLTTLFLVGRRIEKHTEPAHETTARMKRVRQANTAPELGVRALLREMGIRYRTCVRSLPGRPDIANQSKGWAIFVHGCFWHGHVGCALYTVPKTNSNWWRDKVVANRARDARKEHQLRDAGLRVLVVWQCELAHPTMLAARLARFIGTAR